MSSLIVTAGHGPIHQPLAAAMETRINRSASDVPGAIPCLDLSDRMPWNEMRIPHFCKFYLWGLVPESCDRIIWIDIDTFLTRPLVEDEFPDAAWCAVRDPWTASGLCAAGRASKADRRALRPLSRYFNAGMMVCTRAAIPAFELAFQIRNRMFLTNSPFDQDHFNYAVWKTLGAGTPDGAGWRELDERYNAMRSERFPQDVVLMHFPTCTRRGHPIEEFIRRAEAGDLRPSAGAAP